MSADLGALLRKEAPWLFEERLGTCVVGSTALATACARAGIVGPDTADLDLSWALDVGEGTALLQHHGVWQKTTEANRERGTLAFKLDGKRIEITSFRTPSSNSRGSSASVTEGDLRSRILADLAGRDMTVGALALWLHEDEILDPYDGLGDWRKGRVVPVGDPAERIEEHPVRWLRYYRRAHQWGFTLDGAVRKVGLDRAILRRVPVEAITSELRAGLIQCASPGQLLMELFESRLLQAIAPELASQFDGRPAGPVRHHPEVSQALHMILALEWIAARSKELDERDRACVMVAVLCHDLGKGDTDPATFPAHHGHENSGVKPLRTLLDRLAGLTDPAGKRLAEAVCKLHLEIRHLQELRAGSRAKLYERYFKDNNFRVDLFALAVGADSGGRLGKSATGEACATQVRASVEWIRTRCATVDAATLYATHQHDKERFKKELHQAYARALTGTVCS